MDKDKEYTFDEIVAMLPNEAKNNCILDKFLSSLTFVRSQEIFKTVDMQRYLKVGYGDTTRIIDALVLLGVIEKSDDTPAKYKVRRSSGGRNGG